MESGFPLSSFPLAAWSPMKWLAASLVAKKSDAGAPGSIGLVVKSGVRLDCLSGKYLWTRFSYPNAPSSHLVSIG